MIANVIDKRSDPLCPLVDAVFEPASWCTVREPEGASADDAPQDGALEFYVCGGEATTVRDALLRAEREWAFPVAVYLYDLGYRPLG